MRAAILTAPQLSGVRGGPTHLKKTTKRSVVSFRLAELSLPRTEVGG